MSRQKGNAAEREVAKIIEHWWQPFEPEAHFVRTPLSGGWGGPSLRGTFGAAGDLMTTSKTFPFAVEVKRREGWTWGRLLKGKPSPVWDWWLQAQVQGEEMQKIPMLWLRKNREPAWHIMLPAWTLDVWGMVPVHSWIGSGLNVGKFPSLIVQSTLISLEPHKTLIPF